MDLGARWPAFKLQLWGLGKSVNRSASVYCSVRWGSRHYMCHGVWWTRSKSRKCLPWFCTVVPDFYHQTCRRELGKSPPAQNAEPRPRLYVFHSQYHVLFRVGFWVLCVYVCVYWGDAWFFWKLQIHSPSVTLKPGLGCWKHPGTPPLAPVRMPVRMPVRTYQCSPALPAAGTLCLMRSE